MTKLRVAMFCISLDGFGAGPDQTLDKPLGLGGSKLHEWIFETAGGQRMIGGSGGEEGPDSDFMDAGFDNVGSWILGRNMFGPIRGEWGDSDWRGWWGEEPPYHCDVVGLTHHAREPLSMDGGTTFHFTDAPLADVRARALEAAAGKDVRVGGGVSTIQQFMRAGLLEELHLPIVPVLLGRGERLFDGVDADALGYEVAEVVPTTRATHVVLKKR